MERRIGRIGVVIMALTTEQAAYCRDIEDAMDDLARGIRKLTDLEDIFVSRDYSTSITDVELSASGKHYTQYELGRAHNACTSLRKWRDNDGTIELADWGPIIDSVRSLA